VERFTKFPTNFTRCHRVMRLSIGSNTTLCLDVAIIETPVFDVLMS